MDYRSLRIAGISVMGVLTDTPFDETVSLTISWTETNPARTRNAAANAFVGMFTEPSVINAPLLVDNATVTPPEGAASARVTVQNEILPTAIVEGEQVTLDTVPETVTVRAPVADVPFSEAITMAV